MIYILDQNPGYNSVDFGVQPLKHC